MNDDIIPAYGEAGPEADAMNHPATPKPPPPQGPVQTQGTTETDVAQNRKDLAERERALGTKPG